MTSPCSFFATLPRVTFPPPLAAAPRRKEEKEEEGKGEPGESPFVTQARKGGRAEENNSGRRKEKKRRKSSFLPVRIFPVWPSSSSSGLPWGIVGGGGGGKRENRKVRRKDDFFSVSLRNFCRPLLLTEYSLDKSRPRHGIAQRAFFVAFSYCPVSPPSFTPLFFEETPPFAPRMHFFT